MAWLLGGGGVTHEPYSFTHALLNKSFKVEWVALGEVLGYTQPTKYLVKSTDYDNAHKTPVLTAGQTFILGYTDETEGIYLATPENPCIIFDDFTTSFHWVNFAFKVKSSALKILTPIQTAQDINFRFIFYAMKCIRFTPREHARHWIKTYSAFQIPLPPLALQAKIVEILDQFNALTTDLQEGLPAEIEAREKQYTHYLNTLLDFGVAAGGGVSLDWLERHPLKTWILQEWGAPVLKPASKHPLKKLLQEHCPQGVEWVELGEIGEFVRGSGLTKADLHPDNPSGELVGAIHYGEIHTFYNTHTAQTKSFISPQLAKKLKPVYSGDLVIVGVSENPADVCKAVAYLGQDTIYIGGDTFALRHQQNPKYLAYLFQTQAFKDFKLKYTCGAKVSRLNLQDLKTFQIPLPPLIVQAQIVEILDQFNALTTDLQEGIPAEIEAREKQYQHYLNALLNFKESV
ncbi:restriction endonuclease subunit S [Helicobacter felis]|uniref:restriction endonuclease subunit S n=1 Tax=Helicobacter felis TaxID=214 RepID=UPI003989A3F3